MALLPGKHLNIPTQWRNYGPGGVIAPVHNKYDGGWGGGGGGDCDAVLSRAGF